MSWPRRVMGSAIALIWLGFISLAAASPTFAHGDVTGVEDMFQHYGVLIFLLAIVLIGAGVLTWVLLSPQPEEAEDEP